MRELPIVRPRFPPLKEFEARLRVALETGQVTNNGSYVQTFERELTGYLGAPTITFNNGQTALMTMLAAADVRGGEVICPSFTFAATPAAIVWAGATPVFADVDPSTLCLDPKQVAKRITEHTKAILGVDPYGIPCNYGALAKVAFSAKVPFVVDSAASFGATTDGRRSTPEADAQIFSFHATKAFSTMEGGALCSENQKILSRAARIRNFGQDDDGNCSEIGLNGKMMEVCALIGLRQFDSWEETLGFRRSAASFLLAELIRMDIPGVSIPEVPTNVRPTWLYRPIMISEDRFGASRDAVVAGMVERGVWVRKYYSPACHFMPAYHRYATMEGNILEWLPVTEQLSANAIALPVYNDMAIEEVTRVATTLRDVWEANRR